MAKSDCECTHQFNRMSAETQTRTKALVLFSGEIFGCLHIRVSTCSQESQKSQHSLLYLDLAKVPWKKRVISVCLQNPLAVGGLSSDPHPPRIVNSNKALLFLRFSKKFVTDSPLMLTWAASLFWVMNSSLNLNCTSSISAVTLCALTPHRF